MSLKKGNNGKGKQKATGEFWNLRLYIAGETARSMAALENLRNVCDQHLAGKYRVEVIDLIKEPQLAAGDQIVAVPTLVRKLPPPLKRLIGDLSSAEKVLVGLDLRSERFRHDRTKPQN
jgi:circadian clock protein KaiB